MSIDPQAPDTRRSFLKHAAAASIGAALAPDSAQAMQQAGAPTDGRTGPAAFRFVHLTDIHVMPELRGADGMAAALKAVEALKPRPDFILTGGDLVFDATEVDAARARSLFELFKKLLADHTSLPVYHTLGNRDLFGWLTPGVTPKTAGYGRGLFMEYLGLSQTHYSFDHKGWRFFVLDNVQARVEGSPYPFSGSLDGPQREWLEQELQRKPAAMPSVICEHIPCMTVTTFHDANYRTPNGEWRFPSAVVCGDAAEQLAIMRDRNVRLCLSGHIHQLDHIEYRGTHFICDGAVCAANWKGPKHGMPEGFGVIDLGADGSVRHEYRSYGWRAAKD